MKQQAMMCISIDEQKVKIKLSTKQNPLYWLLIRSLNKGKEHYS